MVLILIVFLDHWSKSFKLLWQEIAFDEKVSTAPHSSCQNDLGKMKFCWRISEDNSLREVVYVVALPTTFPKLGKMMLKHLVCYVWLGVSVGLKTWRTLVVYSSLGLDVREEKIWGCKCSTWHSGFKKGQNIIVWDQLHFIWLAKKDTWRLSKIVPEILIWVATCQ